MNLSHDGIITNEFLILSMQLYNGIVTAIITKVNAYHYSQHVNTLVRNDKHWYKKITAPSICLIVSYILPYDTNLL